MAAFPAFHGDREGLHGVGVAEHAVAGIGASSGPVDAIPVGCERVEGSDPGRLIHALTARAVTGGKSFITWQSNGAAWIIRRSLSL